MNDSSTGGFLKPAPLAPGLETKPPHLTLPQFIQTVLVGITGIDGKLVVPQWQPEMPKEPDITVNWIAFGIGSMTPDASAFVGFDSDGNTQLSRQELLEITCHVYGPDCYNLVGILRDGFQIPQNRQTLLLANMGFAYDSTARHLPDFVNGRWNDRYITEIFLRRQIQRHYPILAFASASGTIHAQTASTDNFTQDFNVEEPE